MDHFAELYDTNIEMNADGPGWGAEWDWDRFNAMTVEVY